MLSNDYLGITFSQVKSDTLERRLEQVTSRVLLSSEFILKLLELRKVWSSDFGLPGKMELMLAS